MQRKGRWLPEHRRCGSPLDLKTLLNLEDKRKENDEFVAKVVNAVIKELNLEKAIYQTIKKMRLGKKFEED